MQLKYEDGEKMKNSKFKSMLVIASICALLSTGCGSRSQNSTKYPNNTKSPNMAYNKDNTSNSKTGQNDQTGIKNIYSQTLGQLVTAKTITQAQSDKVLSTLTQNMSQGQMETPNQNQMGTSYGTSSNNMDLSSLIKSKVITQEQADTINQKIQESMKNMKTK